LNGCIECGHFDKIYAGFTPVPDVVGIFGNNRKQIGFLREMRSQFEADGATWPMAPQINETNTHYRRDLNVNDIGRGF